MLLVVSATLPFARGRVRAHEVVGQAVEVRRIELERADVRGDVRVELLAELDQLLAQRLHAGARGVVLVDAGAPEVAQRLLDVVLRRRVGARQFRRASAS